MALEKGRESNLTSICARDQWIGHTLLDTTTVYRLVIAGGFVRCFIVRIVGVRLIAFVTGAIASRLVPTVIMKGEGDGIHQGQRRWRTRAVSSSSPR